MMIDFTERNGDLAFNVRVVPRAAKSEIVGVYNNALKLRLAAPPTGGAANAELVKLLAREFDVSKSAVEIVGGQTSKLKQVKISGATAARLSRIANPGSF